MGAVTLRDPCVSDCSGVCLMNSSWWGLALLGCEKDDPGAGSPGYAFPLFSTYFAYIWVLCVLLKF